MDLPVPTRLRINGRTLDLVRGSLIDEAGRPVVLRPQSTEVLKLLAASPGTLLGKDELIRQVWGSIAVTDDSLVQCIADIRRALGDEAHEIVRTIPRRGYVLQPPEASPPESSPAASNARRWRLWSAVAAGIIIIAGLATLLFHMTAPDGPAPGRTPSIAVLPFDDLSADKSLGYMGDGVAEDIISMLARAPDVLVVARNSSFAYKGTPVDIRKVGSELGVDYVLEGSVRREAQKLRIVAQLNDTRTGEHLWAERFDKAGTDPWALQDEVTGRIIASLTGERGELKRAQYREAWGRDTARLGEYDYFLRGLALYMEAEEKPEYDRARDIWLEGLRNYPDSSMLRAKLGWYHWTLAWDFYSDDVATDFAGARRYVNEALAMSPLSPEVRRSAHWLNAFVLMQGGEFERAVAEAQIAAAVAPYDARMLRILTEVLAAAGRYELALAWLATAEPREPGLAEKYHLGRGYIYRLMGRYEDSIREYDQLVAPKLYQLLSHAISLRRAGQPEKAKANVKRALEDAPDFTVVQWREASFYSDPAILDGEISDLIQAGLPEK